MFSYVFLPLECGHSAALRASGFMDFHLRTLSHFRMSMCELPGMWQVECVSVLEFSFTKDAGQS